MKILICLIIVRMVWLIKVISTLSRCTIQKRTGISKQAKIGKDVYIGQICNFIQCTTNKFSKPIAQSAILMIIMQKVIPP